MTTLSYKTALRHSGNFVEEGNIKPGSYLSKTFSTRRLHTEGDAKSINQTKYVLKKGHKPKLNYSNNASKQNINVYRGSQFLNRFSYNQFEWGHGGNEASILQKKTTLKPAPKAQELDKLVKRSVVRRTLKTEMNETDHKKYDIKLEKSKLFDIYFQNQNQAKSKQKRKKVQKSASITKNQNKPQNKPEIYEISQNKLLGAGTFGKVYEAISHQGQQVAIKKVFNDKAYKSREVDLMELVNSKFVIEMLNKYTTIQRSGGNQKQYVNIVMPKYQSSLYDYLKKINYNIAPKKLKLYLYQMFRGMLHLHSKNICHRDLKPQNMLIKGNKLVVCDLGSAKILKSDEANISYICSRCYRAPELIFQATNYTVAVDMWSAGCIILQILNKNPYFIGKDSLHHLIEIMKVMGTPTKKQVLAMNPSYDISSYNLMAIKKTQWSNIFHNADPLLLDLVSKIMTYNPNVRLSAGDALCHKYFDELRNRTFQFDIEQDLNIRPIDLFTFQENEKKIVTRAQKLVPHSFNQ